MLKSILMSFVFLAGVAAHAEQSEFFFQTEAGKSDLTPRIGYETRTTKVEGGTTDEKANGLAKTGIAYEYGINEMFAIEAALNFKSLETDSTPKTKESGLEDPEVTLKGTSAMSFGRLRYGARLGLGFEKMKIETNGDRNAASGGFSLMPYIGADMDAGGGILGGRLSYDYKMERTLTPATGADVKVKDGHELGLNVFYEYFFADMLLGGSFNYISASDSKFSDGGATAEESFDQTGISIYSRMPMGTWALIPRLDYDFSHKHYDKWDDLTFSVAARFTF